MTNNVPLETGLPYMDQVLKWNDALYSLPALPIVLIGCLAAGYALKYIPVYSNRWIPAGVISIGIATNLFITPLTTKYDYVKAFVLGLVAGVGAIIIHRKWLWKLIDTKLFDDDTSSNKIQ